MKNTDSGVEKYIDLFAYLYLTVPIAIFAFGWLKPAYAIFYSGILLVSLYKIHRCADIHVEIRHDAHDKQSIFTFVTVCLVGFAWVYFSGIGGFSFQNADFEIRNAYLRDLTFFRWPVVFSYDLNPNNGSLAGHRGALAYYLTFWLPAACVGKLTGWHGANIFLFLWSLTGIYLLFYFMFRYLKSKSIWIVIIFVFWSGLDIVGYVCRKGGFKMGEHIEWWAGMFQYSSFTTALYWTFNQAIPIWLIVALIINHKHSKNVVYLYAAALPYSPFSFIGLTPYVIYYMIKSINKNDSMPTGSNGKPATLFDRFSQIATFQNILFPILTLLVFGSYFTSKRSSYISRPLYLKMYAAVLEHHSFHALKYMGAYVVFCFLEFGIYAIILKSYKREPLYGITLGVLLALPFFDYFDHNLIMRASFPALLILMLYTAKFLIYNRSSHSRLFLLGVLLIGSFTPLTEIYRSIAAYVKYPHVELLADHFVTFSAYSDNKKRFLDQHVAVDPEKSVFFSKFVK